MIDVIDRDSMEYDVLIVGAGPAGLSAAIRLKQLSIQSDVDISICIVEKGSEVGAHILSGAVLDPKALNELIPDWYERNAPLDCPVVSDQFSFLTTQKSFNLPIPPYFHNEGNFVISLGLLCRWLAKQAEEMGIEIYPGFSATQFLYREDGSVKGVITGDMGVGKQYEATDQYQAGMALFARQTILSEGCRGSLSKMAMDQFDLNAHCEPQTYGLGVKEIWEVGEAVSQPGKVMHSIGWPLDGATYGGSFIYHLNHNKIAVGFVVGLDYCNPYLSPFEEFQRFKTHPDIRPLFEGARRIAYGARALNEGGWQSLPKLTFPGGLLVGDAAGFLNVPRIKGIHLAMKSGMLAAEAVADVLLQGDVQEEQGIEATSYTHLVQQSWLRDELYQARNIRPAFKWGLYAGIAYGALDTYVLKGKAPWTLKHHGTDYGSLKKAQDVTPIDYPKPDGVITFDRLSSVYLSGTDHVENQPVHLQLQSERVAIDVNYHLYASPETRYCPAGVYEIIFEHEQPKLQINAQNCVHCKTCDIKDPTQNINWQCPEGGGGPNYSEM